MDKKQMIEKVAAGLRRMNTKPDYFLWLLSLSGDYVWDEEQICGITVIYTSSSLTTSESDCPFHPCWKNEKDYILEVSRFKIGFEDY